jgi:hypothetical protein
LSVSGTITLVSTLPTITDTAGLTIDGTGQTLIISGNHAMRVAAVLAGASLTLSFPRFFVFQQVDFMLQVFPDVAH